MSSDREIERVLSMREGLVVRQPNMREGFLSMREGLAREKTTHERGLCMYERAWHARDDLARERATHERVLSMREGMARARELCMRDRELSGSHA